MKKAYIGIDSHKEQNTVAVAMGRMGVLRNIAARTARRGRRVSRRSQIHPSWSRHAPVPFFIQRRQTPLRLPHPQNAHAPRPGRPPT